MIKKYSSNGDLISDSEYIDLEGNPIEKTPITHPYSFELHITYGKPNLPKGMVTDSAYTDRLSQWDYKKYDKCCKSVFGNKTPYWDSRKTEDIEKFLKLYFNDDTLKLIRISKCCNVSNGFPLWLFDWNSKKDEKGR